jgi:hypothetical protein
MVAIGDACEYDDDGIVADDGLAARGGGNDYL